MKSSYILNSLRARSLGNFRLLVSQQSSEPETRKCFVWIWSDGEIFLAVVVLRYFLFNVESNKARKC